MTKLVIIDGYVDEPTVLGVPFFIATYPRYAAGAAKLAGIPEIIYLTIEQIRERNYRLPDCDAAVLIAGNPVPGKYLGGMPIKAPEFEKISLTNEKIPVYVGGPAWREGLSFDLPNLSVVRGDIESFVHRLITTGKPVETTRTIEELNRFAAAGASIVEQHPRFPDVMVEIETGRGCKRREHCSFCVEGLYSVDHREPGDIVAEMKELYRAGVRHFRLSKQADLFAYGSKMTEWRKGFPKPEPEQVRRLYEGIRDALPDLETLHLDNVNPGTIANFPDESAEIIEIVSANDTEGDVAAMGLESADPDVAAANFLKASADEVFFAVKLMNDVSGKTSAGVPKLLPGINLIRGLAGESRETFRLNYEFLKRILDTGLLLRRINIRQLKISGSTPAAGVKPPDRKEEMKLDAAFRKYREMIRSEIDEPMLKKIYPLGTVFHNVIVEQNRGDWSLARPIATYPIVINLPRIYPELTKLSAFVVGYRERSLVGLPFPFELSKASLAELRQLPGMPVKRAGDLFVKGASPEDLKGLAEWEKWIGNIV